MAELLHINAIPISCCYVNRDFQVIECNDRFRALFERQEISPETDLSDLLSHTGSDWADTPEVATARNDNRRLTLHWQADEEQDGYHLCITETEQPTKRKEDVDISWLESFVDHFPGMLYIKDQELKHLFINKRLEKFVGSSVVNQKTDAIFSEEITNKLEAADRMVIKTGEPQELTFTADPKTANLDEPIIFSDYKFPIDLPNGERLLAGIALDITDLHRTQNELSDQLELIESINSELPGLIVNMVRYGPGSYQITYASEGAERFTGDVSSSQIAEDMESGFERMTEESRTRLLNAIEVSAEQMSPIREKIEFTHSAAELHWAKVLATPTKKQNEIHWSGLFVDITQEEEARRDLEMALEEKRALIQEINHRVKNNMAIIKSLLEFKAMDGLDPEAKEALRSSSSRIHTMATVHNMLYEGDTVSGLSFMNYTRRIGQYLIQAYDRNSKREITLELDGEDLTIPLKQAMPLGLIMNELISNSIRHSFRHGQDGTITITSRRSNENLQIIKRDNGVGVDSEAHLSKDTPRRMGWYLVKQLSEKQLRGSISIEKLDPFVVELGIPAEQ